MHTHNAKGGTRFHYNPDGSGEVIVTRVTQSAPLVETREEIRIPGDDLIEFVGELVRYKRMSEIESADAAALVGL